MSLFDGFRKKKAEQTDTKLENQEKGLPSAIVNDGDGSEGFYFANIEEMAAYGKTHGTGKNVLWLTGSDYSDAYRIGFQLFEKGQYRQAIEAYQNCFKLNPVALSARFEICEAYLKLRDLANAKNTLNELKKYLIRKEDIARFYRRIGFIETEQRNYRVAEACLLYSIKYEDIKSAQSELLYIRAQNHKPVKPNEIERVLSEANIPLLEPETVEKTVVQSIHQVEEKTMQNTCPRCGATITHTYRQFYEVSKRDHRIKDKLLHERGEFFESQCPKCGIRADIMYPLQYVDVDKKLNIFLMPIGHPEEKKFLDNVEQYNIRPGFATRLVADGDALVDKISIFDAGLDDRVVEICKILMWGDLCEQQPKYVNAKCDLRWFIHSEPGKEYENTLLFGYEMGGERDSVILELSEGYYENIRKHFEPVFHLMPLKTFEEVNKSWANRAIDIFMQKKNSNNDD